MGRTILLRRTCPSAINECDNEQELYLEVDESRAVTNDSEQDAETLRQSTIGDTPLKRES